MADALEYLTAAVIDRMRLPNGVEISSIEALQQVLTKAYGFSLDIDDADIVARRLEQLGFLSRVTDQYAGTYFVPANSFALMNLVSNISSQNRDSQLAQAIKGGPRLLGRVFENRQFWSDLREQLSGEVSLSIEVDSGIEVGIPAADRVVTLSHNQQLSLEEASSEVIDNLSKENSIDGDSTFREIILGQIRAGRELIRAQSFKIHLLQEMLITALGGLIERYKDQAIGLTAKKLLDLLIEHVFGK